MAKTMKAQAENWDRAYPPPMTYEEIAQFWKWFLKMNDVPKREFLKELKYDNNHLNALKHLFAKMNA